MHQAGNGPYGALVASALIASNGAYGAGQFGISGTAAVVASSVYTVTLSPGIDNANVVWFANPTSGDQSVAVLQTSDTTLAVSVFDAAGAAEDGAFYLVGWRKGIN